MKNFFFTHPSKGQRVSRQRDAGETTIEVLMGLLVGALVIGGFAAFWVVSTHTAQGQGSLSRAEADAVKTVNFISRDVQDAETVLFANDSEMVVEDRTKANVITRTRYRVAVDGTGKTIYRQVWKTAPVAYNYATPGWTAIADTKFARKLTTDATVKFFRFYDKDGAALVPPVAGMDGNGDAKKVERVDVHFKATGGKGFVELKSSAAVDTKDGDGGAAAPVIPLCPVVSIDDSGTSPILTWTASASANTYEVRRNGSGVLATILATSARTYTDSTAPVGVQSTYQIVPIGPGGSPASCPGAIFTPRPVSPAFNGVVVGADMMLNWPAVAGVDSYRLEWRNADPTTYAGSGAWSNSQTFPADPATFTATASWTRNITTPNGANAYTFAPAGSSTYEFRIFSVSNTLGTSNPSSQYTLMNWPRSISGLTSTAQYLSQNRVTWTAEPTATKYTVDRLVSGRAGATSWVTTAAETTATTKVDKLLAGAAFTTIGQSATDSKADPQWLGYTYSYGVRGTNNGPREFDDADPSKYRVAESTGPRVGTAYFPQFPEDPATLTAVGSETTVDGSNAITWGTARGASTYETLRTWKNDLGTFNAALAGQTKLLSAGTDRAVTDTGRARGSRHFYATVAKNAAGYSPTFYAGATNRKSAYQRPLAPVPSYELAEAQPSLDSNSYYLQWAHDASGIEPVWPEQANQVAGAAAGADYSFCTEPAADCHYEAVSKDQGSTDFDTIVDDEIPVTEPYFDATASGWGITDKIGVKACNLGGCSTDDKNAATDATAEFTAAGGTFDVKTYPSAFAPAPLLIGGSNGSDISWQIEYDRWESKVKEPESRQLWRRTGRTRMRWSPSEGYLVKFDVTRTTTDLNAKLQSYAATTAPGVYFDQSLIASPGTKYDYTVVAKADNGLQRPWGTSDGSGVADVSTPPLNNAWYTADVTCHMKRTTNTYSQDVGEWGSMLIFPNATRDMVVTVAGNTGADKGSGPGEYNRDNDYTIVNSTQGKYLAGMTTEEQMVFSRGLLHANGQEKQINFSTVAGKRVLDASKTIGTAAAPGAGPLTQVWGSEQINIPVAQYNFAVHNVQTYIDPTDTEYGVFNSYSKFNTDTKGSGADIAQCPNVTVPAAQPGVDLFGDNFYNFNSGATYEASWRERSAGLKLTPEIGDTLDADAAP